MNDYVSKAEVLDVYAELYDVFDDNRAILKEISKVYDKINALKEQVPRVMTLEEALSTEVNVDVCWLEVKGIKMMYLADAVVCPEHLERADIQRWGAHDCQLPLDLYGKMWRCWTSRPTNKQREAVPWKQTLYE